MLKKLKQFTFWGPWECSLGSGRLFFSNFDHEIWLVGHLYSIIYKNVFQLNFSSVWKDHCIYVLIEKTWRMENIDILTSKMIFAIFFSILFSLIQKWSIENGQHTPKLAQWKKTYAIVESQCVPVGMSRYSCTWTEIAWLLSLPESVVLALLITHPPGQVYWQCCTSTIAIEIGSMDLLDDLDTS